jgi:hypothetical protein
MSTKLPWIKLAEPNGPPRDEHKDVYVIVNLGDDKWDKAFWSNVNQEWFIPDKTRWDSYLKHTPKYVVTHYLPINTETDD